MRSILLAVMVAAAPFAMANDELEQVGSASLEAQFSKKQVELAQNLPRTFVIRENLKTKVVEVIPVKEELKPGEKISKTKFETLAQNSELKGIAYNSTNELEATSSTSSWWAVGGWGGRWAGGWGGGYGYGGGWARPIYPVAYGYNVGYAAGYLGANYCGGYGGCIPQYYPQVYCGGYAYGYAPYYGYAAGGYQYTYAGWGGY